MNGRNRFSCISFFLFLGVCLSVSQVFSFSNSSSIKKEKLISKDALADDIDAIVSLLEDAHADPYRSKAENNLKGAVDGTYITSDSKKIRDPGINKQRFRGKTFLLTSHTTNSAGVVTAAIFQHGRMGSVIGQETAGRIRFCSDPVTKKLPHTGFVLNIPVEIYSLPGQNPDRGVIPDIIVNYSLEDFISQRDLEMDQIRELIFLDKR